MALFAHIVKQKNVQMFAITMQNIKYALIEKKCSNSTDLLSITYHEFLNMFSWDKADTLSSHQSQNHIINLLFKAEPKHSSLYFMITDEFKVLKKWLNENLQKEFICLSTFFISSLVIFVHKFGRGIQIYMNYQKLNNIIIKNQYFIS